jgi:predicted metal-dependent hydrolase
MTMLDWLRREPPTVMVAGRVLPITIRRMRTARRLTLRLGPQGREVRVTLPQWVPTAEAVDFARERADWLARQLADLPEERLPELGAALPYRGGELAILHELRLPRTPQISDDGAIRLGGPAETVTPRLHRWLLREAQRLIAGDLAFYCARADRPAPRLALANARKRWGSCAANGSIRINWRLVMAPDFVRRSVVAHEVAHLVHFDHSPRFHALLAEIYEGDMAAANRWLKEHGRSLYGAFG